MDPARFNDDQDLRRWVLPRGTAACSTVVSPALLEVAFTVMVPRSLRHTAALSSSLSPTSDNTRAGTAFVEVYPSSIGRRYRKKAKKPSHRSDHGPSRRFGGGGTVQVCYTRTHNHHKHDVFFSKVPDTAARKRHGRFASLYHDAKVHARTQHTHTQDTRPLIGIPIPPPHQPAASASPS